MGVALLISRNVIATRRSAQRLTLRGRNNNLPNGIYTSQNPLVLTYDVELSNDCYTEHYAGNFYYSNSENCTPTPYQINMQSIDHSPTPCCIGDITYFFDNINIDPHDNNVPLIVSALNSITFLDEVKINQTRDDTYAIFKAGQVIHIYDLTEVGDPEKIMLDFIIEPCANRFEEIDFNDSSTNTEVKFNKPATGLVMYPNPASNTLTIEYAVKEQEQVLVNIYDLSSRLLKNIVLNGDGNNVHSINISDLNDGLYLVELIQNNEKKTGKFIVQR